jgi:hypothetical protein
VFENRMLRGIFGHERDEMAGEWRKLPNEKLRESYSSPSIIRIIKRKGMKRSGHAARMGEKRNVYRIFSGKPKIKSALGIPRCKGVDNIGMDLREVGWGDIDWSGLAQDRNIWRALVSSVLKLWVPQNAGKLLSGLTTGGLSSSTQQHTFRYYSKLFDAVFC